MRICWFNDNRFGLVKGDRVFDVTKVLDKLPKITYPYSKGDPVITNLDKLKPDILAAAEGAQSLAAKDVKFLSPVQAPSKVIGTPTNYKDHIAEANEQREVFGGASNRYTGSIEEQGLFLKANSALIGPGEGVRLRFPQRRTDHEMELGCIIGRKASNISKADALSYVCGWAIALDMVVRGTQDRSFRKSVDTYAVLGPWLVTADEIADPANLDFSLAVNGQVKQKSNTKYMIMDLPTQIAWASEYYTLWPGDIIMTGTCAGVSQVKPGDVMHCEIQTIGSTDVRILGNE
jgi:2-keto-4-pentenoate hydratase/2-oxohepta-3-ene-1,7-dioic acid hydratase in catechol pathway